MALSQHQMREVTFLASKGAIEIRMVENSVDAMVRTAEILHARYFVAVDGWRIAEDLPVWGVFDCRTAQKNNPVPGATSINNPLKTFVAETPDAAVMWAIAKGAQ